MCLQQGYGGTCKTLVLKCLVYALSNISSSLDIMHIILIPRISSCFSQSEERDFQRSWVSRLVSNLA